MPMSRDAPHFTFVTFTLSPVPSTQVAPVWPEESVVEKSSSLMSSPTRVAPSPFELCEVMQLSPRACSWPPGAVLSKSDERYVSFPGTGRGHLVE
jgi:hypothetical protein